MKRKLILVFSLLVFNHSIICFGSNYEKKKENEHQLAKRELRIQTELKILKAQYLFVNLEVLLFIAQQTAHDVAITSGLSEVARAIQNNAIIDIKPAAHAACNAIGEAVINENARCVARSAGMTVAKAAVEVAALEAAASSAGKTHTDIARAMLKATLISVLTNRWAIEGAISTLGLSFRHPSNLILFEACLQLLSYRNNGQKNSLDSTLYLLYLLKIMQLNIVSAPFDSELNSKVLNSRNHYGLTAFEIYAFHKKRLQLRYCQTINQLNSVALKFPEVLFVLITQYMVTNLDEPADIALEELENPTILDPHPPAAAAAAAKIACDGLSAVGKAYQAATAHVSSAHVQVHATPESTILVLSTAVTKKL